MSQVIYSIFEDLVDNMTSNPSFSFGYWPEIHQELLLKGKNKANDGTKYPLIVMHSDFEEKRGEQNYILAEINPKFYLITESKQNYTTAQRITLVYNTVLYPLYEEFMTALKSSGDLISGTGLRDFEHTKKDLFYLGSLNANQNKISDVVDAIELSFKSLKIRKQKCNS